jgi:PilZ domain
MEERRSEVRMLCSDLVPIRWEHPAGVQRTATAILEDISFSGACLQLETPLDEGVHLSIMPAGTPLRGTVRYCVLRGGGYFAGIRFDDGCRWSIHQYEPMHLLDPLTLREGGFHI